jgi:rhamnulose-1-phosphate aldolase
MKLKKRVQSEISKVSEIAGYLWQRGWCERNAGNISIDLTGLINIAKGDLHKRKYVNNPVTKEAAQRTIFITGAGERLRDLIHAPEAASCIIHIDEEAQGYYIVWGGEGKPMFRPTSEFASHVALHLFNAREGNGMRCVVHTHPVELIAISHHPTLGQDEKALNKALWSMLPEIRIYVPKGISIAPYELPGSEALALRTIEGLKYRDVILWSKHGALAVGKDAIEAFDFIDVANKGAIIYLKCLQAGYPPVGMTEEEVRGLDVFIKNGN